MTSQNETLCPNCGCSDVQAFCPRCGQENVPSAVPVREILLGFLDEFLKFDTRLWSTLKALVAQPGFLTREYLAGRRVRSVAPIKLYLALSFLAFVVFALVPSKAKQEQGLSGFSEGSLLAGMFPGAPRATPAPEARAPESADPDDPCKHLLEADRAKQSEVEQERQRNNWLSANRSTINLIRIPAYALLLAWIFRRLRRLYVEHLIFVLHTESFNQIVHLGQLGLQKTIAFLAGPIALAMPIYFFLACRRVYEQPRRTTLLAMIGFFLLSQVADWLTGVSAGLIYRLTTPN